MKRHHKYSLTELENMVPYELDAHIALISQDIENQKNSQFQSAGDGGYSAMLAEMKHKNG